MSRVYQVEGRLAMLDEADLLPDVFHLQRLLPISWLK
jgi:hypothetical protein